METITKYDEIDSDGGEFDIYLILCCIIMLTEKEVDNELKEIKPSKYAPVLCKIEQ
jgi:hypothetical protein